MGLDASIQRELVPRWKKKVLPIKHCNPRDGKQVSIACQNTPATPQEVAPHITSVICHFYNLEEDALRFQGVLQGGSSQNTLITAYCDGGNCVLVFYVIAHQHAAWHKG